MTTTSTDAAKQSSRIRSPLATKGIDSKRQARRKTTTVPWYGSLLIFGMLVAAGWEIFRWILAIITLD